MVFNDTFNNISVILVEETRFVLLPISRVVLFFIAPSVFSNVLLVQWYMELGHFMRWLLQALCLWRITSTFDIVLNNLVEICLGYTEQNISLKVNLHDIMF